MGMVTHRMIQDRMQEEIDELRAALAEPTVQESLTVAESAVKNSLTTQRREKNS
jgi:hypothetical protein